MRYLIGCAAALLVILAIPSTPAEACNAQGRYCSYPAWASNAFAGRGGRMVNPYNSTQVRSGNGKYRR